MQGVPGYEGALVLHACRIGGSGTGFLILRSRNGDRGGNISGAYARGVISICKHLLALYMAVLLVWLPRRINVVCDLSVCAFVGVKVAVGTALRLGQVLSMHYRTFSGTR